MLAMFGYPKYMPSPYSVYLSNFSAAVLAFLKEQSPFARYHKADREYEVTPEVYASAKRFEETVEGNSLPDTPLYVPYSYSTDYPYQYQDDAIVFARTHNSMLINFSQGMGKSYTTMRILESRGCKRSLIITGVSNLQEEWLKDAEKHKTSKNISYREYLNMHIAGDGPQPSVAKRIEWLSCDRSDQPIYTDLIGIESCRSEALVAAINANHYDAIVVDEIQAAKGMKAEQTQGVHEIIATPDQLRIALSGTPVLNDPLEYYSVLRFLGVLYYKSKVDQCSRSTFNRYYGEWGFDYFGHFVCTGYRNLDQLKLLVNPILVHAPKSLLKLPPKHREITRLTVQNPRYEELCTLHSKGSAKVKKAGYKTIQALAAELQVMTSTDLSKLDIISQSAKIGERPLIFSQYTTVLDTIKEHLEDQGLDVAYYHGKLNSKARLAVLEKWKSGKGDVILLSISCSRYGLNLQETQVCYFMEPPTSPAILEQAEDRLHRIGQTKEVYSRVLLAGEGDEFAWRTLENKQQILSA